MDNITRGDFGRSTRRALAKKRKKRTLLILLCLLAVMLITFFSPLFKISNITVSGIRELTPEYVLTSAGLESGVHLTKVDFSGAEKALSKTAYISSAQVKYKFPNALEVIVEEKMPVVYYRFADGYVGINVDGVVTDIIQTMEKQLPVANGISLGTYSIGQKPELANAEAVQIDALTTVAGTLYDLEMSDSIAVIDVSEITNIRLTTTKGINVKCGNTAELSYKFSVLREVILREDCSGTVDISTPGQATYEIM